MTETAWYESYFGDDYFDIHRDDLTDELTQPQVNGIVSLLGLEPGARILDLACGHGRHSIPLAKLGFDVTGFDLSQKFLDRARADAVSRGASVRLIRGDMRELPFADEFDAVINIFTAFGYFDDPEDDLRAVEGVRRALKPGGKFLLETVHRDALAARFRTRNWDMTSAGSYVLRGRHLDLATDVIHENVVVIRADGSRTEHQLSMRMRSLSGYLTLLRNAGLKPEAWYGGLDGQPLEVSSWRMVVVSGKPRNHS